MKLLIMCEGPNELAIMRILLRNNLLAFSEDDLLNLVPYHARQIKKSAAVQTALNLYPGEVKILRVGDGLNEKLVIPKEYEERVIGIEKYCTKPELEMLLIIAEKQFVDYEKVKSSMKPKIFAKNNVKCGRKKYDNSTSFYMDYFGTNPDVLVMAIKEYKRLKGSHKKDEFYLADLLKPDTIS
ncbi:GNAT family acetyltransferase [Hespellia stercorisuis]|uniref:Uncharacterized protein n=1 Tax=Hespellia stercorisuis DSM 15480 TaxID=1121950 RepID=A0A1M6S7T6_9FIRM|nr:GNAT family acetyltransferase [Hespellia stercorisuis]SHK40588.1 hypothetical protein SAMN02745243_02867 [Hespellia stercorisuis DSM 15480]